MSTIGVVIFSLTGMRSLEACLKSIRWADAVMILHLGEGEPPVPKDLPPFGRVEWAFSVEQAAQCLREMKTDWILHLWGEERLNERLQEEILSLRMKEAAITSRAYRLDIRTRILNRWVKGSLWGPSPGLRLTAELRDLGKGWWEETGAGNRERGPRLGGWVEDYATADLAYGLERINQFSARCAERIARKGLRFGAFSTAIYSLWVGMRLLAMNRVVAQGLAGVTFSILAGYSVLLVGAKRWEKGIKVERVMSKNSELGRQP